MFREKKSDILVIYPELNMLRYECQEFSPGLYGVVPRYTLKKIDTCHYALKSSICFNLISDTAWC